MSTEKFTSLHSGLIARKGEALPTQHFNLDAFEVERPATSASASASRPRRQNCDMPADLVRPTRPQRISGNGDARGVKALTFRLDPALYHRVQVAAAKLGWTSQDLLRAAVERHLMHLGTEVFPNCGCITGDDGCH